MDGIELTTLLQKLHEAESAIVETEAKTKNLRANDAGRAAARALEALRSPHEILPPTSKVRRSQ